MRQGEFSWMGFSWSSEMRLRLRGTKSDFTASAVISLQEQAACATVHIGPRLF